MKRFMNVVLTLCIATMCTTPFEAQGQNRRTGTTSNGTANKEQSSQTRSTGSAQVQKSAQAQLPAQTTQKPAQTTQKSAQVQDRRTNTTVGTPNSSSRSAQISRKNSPVQQTQQAKQAQQPKQTQPKVNPAPRDPRPAAPRPAPGPAPRPAPKPAVHPPHPPMPSYHYGDHYFGQRIRVLPRGYTVVHAGGITYYLSNGVYYRPYLSGGYYICRPPKGTVIAQTLFNVALTAVAVNTIRDEIQRASRAAAISSVYAAANTGYTVRTRDDYAGSLQNQADQQYYYQDGVFYILQNGQYYVIEAPIGALVTEIPADYQEIELDGRTYYQVEDTLYKTTVIEGTLYFEVVCNL